MVESNKRLERALELHSYLDAALPVGFELRDKIVQLLKGGFLADATRCSRELSQVGLNGRSAYVQGIASHLLGVIYFSNGNRAGDLDRALEYFQQSRDLFHSSLDHRHEHNEGVAWLSMGLVYEEQSVGLVKDRWKESINVYQEAGQIFRIKNDVLTDWAERAERRMTGKYADWLVAKNHAEKFSNFQPPLPTAVPIPPPSNIEQPTETPNGLAKPKRVPRRLAVIIVLGFIAVSVILLQTILLTLAGIGLTYVWNFFPETNTVIRVAIGISMLFTSATLLALAVSGQLFCRVRPEFVAVYVYPRQKRIWIIDEPGRYWVDLSQAHVAAYIARFHNADCFLREHVVSADGFTISVRMRGAYSIVDASRMWEAIHGSLEHTHLFGIPYPAPLQKTAVKIAEQTRPLILEALREAAGDRMQRNHFRQSQTRDEHFRALFTTKCDHLGVRFESVQVQPFVHHE